MRRSAIWLFLAAVLVAGFRLPVASFAHAASHDGEWSVLIITEKGDCDRAYRYAVSVANGQVTYAGEASVNMEGTVAPDGAVHVSIRLQRQGRQRQRALDRDLRRRDLAWRWTECRLLRPVGAERRLDRACAPLVLNQRGASSITIWRPSKRGSDSTLEIVAVSSLTRWSSL